jgi:sugar phosphate isomerase/epimerase
MPPERARKARLKLGVQRTAQGRRRAAGAVLAADRSSDVNRELLRRHLRISPHGCDASTRPFRKCRTFVFCVIVARALHARPDVAYSPNLAGDLCEFARFTYPTKEFPFMTTLSMNEITTFRWSLEEDIENYQEAGYRGIGVWRQKLSDEDEERAIDLLAASGLEVTNLTWAGGFTGSDGRTLEESIDDARHALRLAAAIRAGCLVVYSGGRNNHTIRHASRLFRTALDELVPLAEAVEVPLAIEPMHPACAAEWTFHTDLPSVLDLIDHLQNPWLKLAVDTYHFNFGALEDGLLERTAPHLAIVHLGDRRALPGVDHERCPLGRGRLPLDDIVAALQTAGYAGAFDVKLMGAEIEAADYWAQLEQSQAAFAELAGAAATRTVA